MALAAPAGMLTFTPFPHLICARSPPAFFHALRRIRSRRRRACPKAKLQVRLDGGFAGPQMFDFLEAERVDYVVAMASNSVLKAFAEPMMKQARQRP